MKYVFMEEMFKKIYSNFSSEENDQMSDESSIMIFKNKKRFQFTLWAGLLMSFFYISVLISHRIDHSSYDKIFFLILSAFIAHLILLIIFGGLGVNNKKNMQKLIKWLCFSLFYCVQVYRLLDSILVSKDEYKIIKNLMTIFFSKFYLILFFKFNFFIITLTSLINIGLVVCIQILTNKHIYIVEFTYSVVIPCACIAARYNYENMIQVISENLERNSKMVTYTDTLINSLPCFFFTLSKGKIVYFNKTIAEWLGKHISSHLVNCNLIASRYYETNINTEKDRLFTTNENNDLLIKPYKNEKDFISSGFSKNKLREIRINQDNLKNNKVWSHDKNKKKINNNIIESCSNINSKANILNEKKFNTLSNTNMNVQSTKLITDSHRPLNQNSHLNNISNRENSVDLTCPYLNTDLLLKEFLQESHFSHIDETLSSILKLKDQNHQSTQTILNQSQVNPGSTSPHRYSLYNLLLGIETANKNDEVSGFFSGRDFFTIGMAEYITKNNKFYFEVNLRKIVLGSEDSQRSWVEVTMSDVTHAQKIKNVELSYKNRENLLAKIAHEFKTPLMCVVSLFEEIQAGMSAAYGVNGVNLPIEIKNKISHVGDLSNYTLFLLSDIIGYLKDSKQNLPLNLENVNVSEVLSFAFRILKTLLIYKKEKFKFIEPLLEIDESDIEIRTDLNRLKQILLNLISNAVKFTKSGFIKINSHVSNGDCVISVEDSGLGIKEEDSKKIFNEEKMLEDHFNENSNGSGLGLSISHNMAKSIGGQLEFSSNYGVGSKFSLKLRGPIMSRRKSLKETGITGLSTFANAINNNLTNINISNKRSNRNLKQIHPISSMSNENVFNTTRKFNSMSNINSLFKSGQRKNLENERRVSFTNNNESTIKKYEKIDFHIPDANHESKKNFPTSHFKTNSDSHQFNQQINHLNNPIIHNSNQNTIKSENINSCTNKQDNHTDHNILLIEKEATDEAASLTTHNLQDIFLAIDESKKLQMIHSDIDYTSSGYHSINGGNHRPGRAILIIDDTPLILSSMERLIRTTLRNMNIHDVEIMKGFDGVDMLRYIVEDQRMNNRILLTIVDEKMEFLNGSEAMKVIRKMEKEDKVKKQIICRLSADSGLSSTFSENSEFYFDMDFEKPLSAYIFQEFFENILR